MANKKPKIERPDPAAALEKLERPAVRWRPVALVALALAVLWAVAIGLGQMLGLWVLAVAGVLTAVVLGFGVYVLRLMRRSQGIVDILKTATDEEGKKAALEKLAARSGDAMAALARAQLVAQEKPNEAIKSSRPSTSRRPAWRSRTTSERTWRSSISW